MKNHVYKLIELTGTSTKSIEEAVNTALKRVGKTVKNLSWFQIVETRGSIAKKQVKHWQVTIKVGFAVTGSQAGPPMETDQCDHL
jgi:flavin-binding protein dodecin